MKKFSPSSVAAARSRFVLPLLLALFAACLPGGATRAQGRQQDPTVPRGPYNASMAAYNSGEYRTALRGFRDSARQGIRNVDGLWVDSICNYAMIGECLYHTGDLAGALEQYESAIKLMILHRDWMTRVEFPAAIEPSQALAGVNVNWGVSGRNAQIGGFPRKMQIFQGRLDNQNVIQRGGVVEPPQLVPVDVVEVVRCSALAIRRRNEIMGPTCQHHPLTQQLVQALMTRPTRANHWSQAWVGVLLGLAHSGNGKTVEAIGELRNSLVVGGQLDHPLTPVALLELGKLAMQQKQHEPAANFFLEATISAAYFGQTDVLEEAFRLGFVNFQIAGGDGVFPPLVNAAAWARAKSFNQLQTSLLISLAENFAALRQTPAAATALADATRAIGRREMRQSDVAARLQYVEAMIAFQGGNIANGTKALASAITYQQAGGSKRLFQIALADQMFVAPLVSQRVARTLFSEVLREPNAADWAFDPLEALSVTVTPTPLPMEHWFEATIAGREGELESGIEIADLIRRHRFFSTLPLGGRLLALRWILEAPDAALTADALAQRQSLLLRFPHYRELQQQAQQLRQQVDALPQVPADASAGRQQSELYAQLASVSTAQEACLREMSLHRVPSDFVFPPRRTAKEIQAGMEPGQLALVYFATSRYVYAFGISRERYAHWQVEAPDKITRALGGWLKDLGQLDRNQVVSADVLRAGDWKKTGAELIGLLAPKVQANAWDEYNELIVVPDSILWHLPFEALVVGEGAEARPLISKLRVRYAPTAALIVPDGRGRKPTAATAVVLGKLMPKEDPALVETTFEDLRRELPRTFALRSSSDLPAPTGLLRTRWNRLLVLDDLTDTDRGPYDWSPGALDRGKPGSELSAWFSLPFGSPDEVILPGYHTEAESGLRRRAVTGDEIFLSVMGMMSTGTRTVLLSRWRTGGPTSCDLIREFTQELPHAPASEAWQRSVKLSSALIVDAEREPRVKMTGQDGFTAEHPFFWAGYLLIDTGGKPLGDHAQE